MGKDKIDVSIIIINYNTLTLTQNSINSIIENTKGINYEIILVDNASIDGSRDVFSKDSRIIFVKSDSNLGFGRANNLGYSFAKGKFILLLNSDTLLKNNAVKFFCDSLETMSADVACLGCILKASDGINESYSYGIFPSISEVLRDIIRLYARRPVKNTLDLKRKYPFRVDYIIGAALFIRRNVIEECGLFDEDFFMYYEETEMQLRYSKKGYKSMIIDGPSIIHLEGASCGLISKPSQKHRLMYFDGMFIYMRKRYPFFIYIIFRILVLLYMPMILKAKGRNYKEVLKLFLIHK